MHHPVVRWSCVLKVIVALGQKIKLMNLSLDSPIRIDYESRVFNRNLFIFYMITPKWINFQVKANWNRPNTRLFRSDLLNFKLDLVGQKQFWLFFRSLQLFFPLLSAPAPSTDWTKLYRGGRTRSIWVSSLSPIFLFGVLWGQTFSGERSTLFLPSLPKLWLTTQNSQWIIHLYTRMVKLADPRFRDCASCWWIHAT